MTTGRLLRYWGKAGPGDSFHPLAYHSLDVAAAGKCLLAGDPLLRRRLAEVSGLGEEPLLDWVTFLLAIHDLGKFADGFQGLRPDLLKTLQGRGTVAGYPERHDLLGYRLWTERLEERLRGDERLLSETGSPDDWRDLLGPSIRAAAGHHGVPPKLRSLRESLRVQFPAEVEEDALAFVLGAARQFLPAGLPFGLEPFDEQEDCFKRASWMVAGLAVAADWIGSNSGWFPFHGEPLEPEDYWRTIALPRAGSAVEASGIAPRSSSTAGGLRSLWPELTAPTPLQALAETLEIGSGPQLFVVEEVTGGGKTEAALVLAHRLMARGLASGIFLGLPTMATANAMYRRVEAVYRKLFGEETDPSLVLAHSRRDLFLPLESPPADSPYAPDEPTASLTCAAWLADSRKKALLAHVGVGTVDQALLGVLPLRHQSLRLWGLAGKVLIVDEVHACDSYVRQLLCDLLEFHAAFGGSAILLSATLPAAQRAELLGAFAGGAGFPRPSAGSMAYPLMTHWSGAGLVERAVEARRSAARRVEVRPLRSRGEAGELLLETLERGGCACWVRNTVRDALEAWADWRERLGADRALLFHSRFTVGDRARIEEEVLRRFGPESSAEDRRGRLLIATQVVEQSLDLDFDLLVTDLAPIDLVVQRAGRLRRHLRDASGNRHDAPDERGPAVLGLHAPEPVEAAGKSWFSAFLSGAAFVYPDHGRLWLTARWLEEHGGFRMPEDARGLIEHVYGPESEERVPAGLRGRTERAAGTARRQGSRPVERPQARHRLQGHGDRLAGRRLPADAPGRAHGNPAARQGRWRPLRALGLRRPASLAAFRGAGAPCARGRRGPEPPRGAPRRSAVADARPGPVRSPRGAAAGRRFLDRPGGG